MSEDDACKYFFQNHIHYHDSTRVTNSNGRYNEYLVVIQQYVMWLFGSYKSLIVANLYP